MVPENSSNCLVCIIAVDGKPRNTDLVEKLSSILPNCSIRILNGLTPLDLDPPVIRNLVEKTSYLLSRPVGDVEIAVTMSHRRAYQNLADSDFEFCLILEDDVTLPDSFKISSEVLELARQSKTIVSFYSPKWSIWILKSAVLKSLFPPAFAAAYLISRDSAAFILSQKATGLADWPVWSRYFKFYLDSKNLVEIRPTQSYINEEREKNKLVSNKGKLIFSGSKEIKKFDQFLNSIWYPIIWKILSPRDNQRSFVLKKNLCRQFL